MPQCWFTADTHMGHFNIIKYCKRPFKSVEEMNETIIKRFNEVLRPGDLLYHLGDVSYSTYDWKSFFGRLRTKEIHLVWGNHDKYMQKQCKGKLPAGIRSVADLRHITVDRQSVMLCHYAMRTWPDIGRGGIQLYGHSHGQLPGVGRQMDVGVDTNEFRPWSWDEIKWIMKNTEYVKYD